MDVIAVTGIRAIGYHGVFENERLESQEFICDIELRLDLLAAGKSDDLTQTVNYADIAEVVVAEITGPSVALIEALAERIATEILQRFRVAPSVKVIVHKPHAPIPVEFADVAVTIERTR